MYKIFKYGKIMDITISCFLCSLLLIGILIYNGYSSNESPNIPLVACKQTYIDIEPLAKSQRISPGDTIWILGQDQKSGGSGMRFWVETENGSRGWVRQEDFDNQAIIYSMEDIDSTMQIALGDTVTILGSEGEIWRKYNIKTQKGDTYQIGHKNILSLTGTRLLDYNLNFNTSYFMSLEKFKRIYLNHQFDEVDHKYRKARLINASSDKKIALYYLSLFDKQDGRFYYPIITYTDGVATSYELKLDKKTNSFILKYLPLVSTILDIHFFSDLISSNVYSMSFEPIAETMWTKTLGIVIAIFMFIGFVAWLFGTNHIISLFLFGTLRFRYPLLILNDTWVWSFLLIIDICCTYIWMILGLCYAYHWWYFIPILLAVCPFIWNRYSSLFGNFPHTRCPKCKTLYSICYNSKEFVKEYDEWRSVTENAGLVSSHTEKWKTWDDVTTKTRYADGTTRTHTEKQNVQNHQQTINTYRYNVYDVLYHVKIYKSIYICSHCGFEEYAYPEDLTELDRKFKNSYVS